LTRSPYVSILARASVRSDSGEILIALHDNAEDFAKAIVNAGTRRLMPDGGRLIGTSNREKKRHESTAFTQLPPGRYAMIEDQSE
jgi:hypothetical protein